MPVRFSVDMDLQDSTNFNDMTTPSASNKDDRVKVTDALGPIIKSVWSIWPSVMPEPTVPEPSGQPISADGRLVYDHRQHYAKGKPFVDHIFKNMMIELRNTPEEAQLTFARLLTEIAFYEKDRAKPGQGFYFEDVKDYLNTALSIVNKFKSPRADAVRGDVHFALGSLAMDLGDFLASRKHKQKSFELITRICNENKKEDMRLYLAYAELGNAHVQDGDLDEGERLLKEAIRIREAAGELTPRSGDANLGLCLIGQARVLREADGVCEITEYEDFPRTDKGEIDTTDLTPRQQKLAEARKLIWTGLDARLEQIGRYSNVPDIRTSLFFCAMADLCLEMGRKDSARTYLELANERVPTLGRFRGNVRIKLASVYLLKEYYHEEAEQLLIAYPGDFTILGDKHPKTHRWEFLRSKANSEYKPNLRHWKPEFRAKFEAGTLMLKDFDPYVAFNER